MSGLLVKSVAVMKENLEEMNAQGVKVPVLLGGAALTRDYAEDDLASLYKGPLLYCKDAFDGLHMMDAIAGGKVDAVVGRAAERARRTTQATARERGEAASRSTPPTMPKVAQDNPVPAAAVLGPAGRDGHLPPRHVFPFINEIALFRGQWGLKQGKLSPEEFES